MKPVFSSTRRRKNFESSRTTSPWGLIARATRRLAPVHQEPGATGLLAEAHLLAGAAYLARNRIDAARQRLARALDFAPDLAVARHRFARRVQIEVAAIRAAKDTRPRGELEIRLTGRAAAPAEVYVDGHLRGETPLVLPDVGGGRHLLRISRRGDQSDIRTIRVQNDTQVLVESNLTPDPEIRQIAQIPALMRTGADTTPILELLKRRGAADGVLLASIQLGRRLSATGGLKPALRLELMGAGVGFAETLDRDAIRRGLEGVLACSATPPTDLAWVPPALGPWTPSASRPEPVPESPAFWERPWFWALTAAAALGLSASVVAARASGSAPDAVEITLIPRP